MRTGTRLSTKLLTGFAVLTASLTLWVAPAQANIVIPPGGVDTEYCGIIVPSYMNPDYQHVSAALGCPSSVAYGLGGGVEQTFKYGVIEYSDDTGAHALWDDIYWKWLGMGAQFSVLGWPTTDETNGILPQWHADFQHGSIYYYSRASVYDILEPDIRDMWLSHGGDIGPLGWLTSDTYYQNGVAINDFTYGHILHGPTYTEIIFYS